jgi:hypothetical protein
MIAGNKIEQGIRNTNDQIFGYARISEAKGKVIAVSLVHS